MCPPEGDAGTGMVATNSVAPRTGNVSAGTSTFAMLVLDKPLSKLHREIDMVTTPGGFPVAMSHANNGTSDLNAWVNLFAEFEKLMGRSVDLGELYRKLELHSLEGDPDCGGLLTYGYYSGEAITRLNEGRPLFVRMPDSAFTLANFMRAHLYSSFAAVKLGLDILLKEKHVRADRILGHGELKKRVYEANMLLPKYGLVTFTWGNVSGVDRERRLFVIKPSGVPCEALKSEDMVVVDFDRNKVEGQMNPSSDTAAHAWLYRCFLSIGGIVHTHSSYATSWAQSGRSIPCYGTTHADYYYGEVPCLRCLSKDEIDSVYERNTGKRIVDEFRHMGKDPDAVTAVLCRNHGPFTWGKDPVDAVHSAVVLEEVAKMAYRTETIEPKVSAAPQELQDKHYYRKHGANAYYGQYQVLP